ncbi:MAG: hypothetical protein ACFE8M_12640 [Candidatus Hermodarchaeota archaeon]
MKPIFQKFFCTECGRLRILKVNDICINCRDKRILSQIQKELLSIEKNN